MNKTILKTPENELSAFSAKVGEHIGAEAGAKMVKTYFDAHPDQAYGHFVGREIIEKILDQPGCAGLGIYPAYNDARVRQLVFVGVDGEGNEILKYSVIGDNGTIQVQDGLVVDRIITTDVPTYNWWDD